MIPKDTEQKRWKIRKIPRKLRGLFPPWEVDGTGQDFQRFFDTWQEALAFADERSRTRQIVLPRVSQPGRIELEIQYWPGEFDARVQVNSFLTVYDLDSQHLEAVGRHIIAISEMKKVEPGFGPKPLRFQEVK